MSDEWKILANQLETYNERIGEDLQDKLERNIEKTDSVFIVYTDMTYEKAKEKTLEYIEDNRTFSIVDMHQKLGIPLELGIRVLNGLKREGAISKT